MKNEHRHRMKKPVGAVRKPREETQKTARQRDAGAVPSAPETCTPARVESALTDDERERLTHLVLSAISNLSAMQALLDRPSKPVRQS
jgi:hypothetical protein